MAINTNMQLDEGATGAPRVAGPRSDTSKVSQAEIDAAVRQAGIDLEVDPVTLAYEAGQTGATVKLNTLSPDELKAYQQGRADKYTQARETGGGTEPPSEAPEGTHWSFINGAWKLYKDFTADSSGGGNNGGNGGNGGGKTVVSTKSNSDGTSTITYSDGTEQIVGTPTTKSLTVASPLSTAAADQKKADRVSAYNILYSEFDKYGLGSLVSDIKNYLIDSTFDPSEFSIQLKNTDAYQKRFSANADRIKAGLSALKPAEYIALEDQYQSLMRNYGLPASYYSKGDLGIQEGFNKLIANDVSATELEDRITTAQKRVVNADPNVLKTLKAFYPDISNGDILAYTLDPKNAIDMIKRKVTAAEIGGTQLGAGLTSEVSAAEALAKAGVTQDQYAQATPFISQASQRGSQLADIYGQTPYDQAAAEAEALNLAGGAQAAAKRKKLTGLETAAFSGSSGVGALGREKAIYGATYGQAGLY